MLHTRTTRQAPRNKTKQSTPRSCAVSRKKFFAFLQPRYVLSMFLNLGHFSASFSFLIKTVLSATENITTFCEQPAFQIEKPHLLPRESNSGPLHRDERHGLTRKPDLKRLSCFLKL